MDARAKHNVSSKQVSKAASVKQVQASSGSKAAPHQGAAETKRAELQTLKDRKYGERVSATPSLTSIPSESWDRGNGPLRSGEAAADNPCTNSRAWEVDDSDEGGEVPKVGLAMRLLMKLL